jgi:hypothetical protein
VDQTWMAFPLVTLSLDCSSPWALKEKKEFLQQAYLTGPEAIP